jgi:anti-sigma regulatory factor (Ser/Thr protein kinase)
MRLIHSELVKRWITVETALAADLPATAGDPVELQQVLLNLFTNAMDAVGSKTPPRRIIRISTRANGKHVEVDITDSGHGIAADDHKRVFEPFFTTKDQGLGLGLSICSTIVKAHEGKLSIHNNDLGGATAVLSLPVAAAPNGTVGKPNLAANSSRDARPTRTRDDFISGAVQIKAGITECAGCLRPPNVRKWHIASLRCCAAIWSHLGVKRTSNTELDL